MSGSCGPDMDMRCDAKDNNENMERGRRVDRTRISNNQHTSLSETCIVEEWSQWCARIEGRK